MENSCSRTWAEINLDNIGHNARLIRSMVPQTAEVMGVVKADAYGHGVFEVVNTLLLNGVTRLAVSMLDEAIQLRQMGVRVPILILSDPEPERIDELIKYGITQTILSDDFAVDLSKRAVSRGKKVSVHIAVDTGMGRIGLPWESAVSQIERLSKLEGLYIEGIFTHFACSDEEIESYTRLQFSRFKKVCDEVAAMGIRIPVKHCANSAAILRFPEMSMDMVRAGIILYGLHPSDVTKNLKVDLRPAMTLKARITLVKSVPKGTYLSYGSTYKTERESVIATVPIGYADGYMRNLSNRAYMLIGGQKVPVRGRVCMDQCMADITDLMTSVKAGDEAVIFGCQNGTEISADELARTAGTINYELVCVIGKRVPRIYIKNGRIANVLNYLIGE
ncbi:MAG: alanine racemase [Clostridia bacterium]|nr:alanine racemase [Clostridia bacterium]